MATIVRETDQVTTLINATSGAATFTSDVLDLGDASEIAVHTYISNSTGSPVGSYSLQGSNVNADARFVQISSAVTTDGDWIYDGAVNVKFIRIVYTRTSGTGAISCEVCTKGDS